METLTVEQRQELGKIGKLWRIEYLFRDEATGTGRHLVSNLTGSEIMRIRENVFFTGLLLPIDPGHWKVVAPADITSIEIWKQEKWFAESY